jgi:hypothetical protein
MKVHMTSKATNYVVMTIDLDETLTTAKFTYGFQGKFVDMPISEIKPLEVAKDTIWKDSTKIRIMFDFNGERLWLLMDDVTCVARDHDL